MKKVAAVLFPLLVIAWIVSVVNPHLIPGAGYVGSYILPIFVIFMIVRAVTAAQKKQVKQNGDRHTAPTPAATWAPPPASTPPMSTTPLPPADTAIPSPAGPTTPAAAPPPPVDRPETASPTTVPPTTTAPGAATPTGVDALPAELVARLRELRTGGRTIEAVELLRERTGMELYEASRLVIGLDADD